MIVVRPNVWYAFQPMLPVQTTPPSSAARETFERLLAQRRVPGVHGNEAVLRSAFEDARAMYGEQSHRLGEGLMEHCLGVLETFLMFQPDDTAVIACLFHHALDTKLWTLDDIEKNYGSDVRALVASVHLLSRASLRSRMSVDSLRLMFLRISDDMRAVLLVLCNHAHVLGRLSTLEPGIRRNICIDTLQLFSPVAARLGIYFLKHRMEAAAFPVVYPVDALRISEQTGRIREQYGDFLPAAAAKLTESLREAGIRATVEGRQKQPYSIFQKMRLKNLSSVQDVYDLFALRVIVDGDGICYQTLGVLHRLGHPVANRFKDYIAFPKPNGYRSIHTTLARLPGVPEEVFIEVQIRTPAMHRDADLGLAAHWSYKEGGTAHASRKAELQRMLTSRQSPEEERQDGPQEHIFVLTPGGDIIELPDGATPLDFAFSVHTMLGLCFKAARVNGVIAPLSHQLENGDIVEIIRHKEPHPSQNWMQWLKTSSARSRLKRYLVERDKPLYIQAGRDAVNAELLRHQLPPLDTDLSALRFFDGTELSVAEREDLLMKVGQGAQNASSLLMHLDALRDMLPLPSPSRRLSAHPFQALKQDAPRMEGGLRLPMRFTHCCKADEAEKGGLIGIVARDGVVRVHRDTCRFISKANPDRMVRMWWEGGEIDN